jgi:dephospho-CoA kinase
MRSKFRLSTSTTARLDGHRGVQRGGLPSEGVGESRPPVLCPYDPRWPEIARELIAALRDAAAQNDWDYDHIGSTAVPGLAAKNIIDLQIRVPHLPSYEDLDTMFGPLGYVRTAGSRPDSPGVYRDARRGSEVVPDEVWEKRLYVRPGEPFVILHVRRMDSPFGCYTVWFRDWLHAHPRERQRYEAVKRQLAAAHSADADYDNYTRAKTAYLDEAQPLFETWARSR